MANFDINSHYIEEANFSQVKFGEDGYLLEVELNESQQIARNKLKEVVKSNIGSQGIYCQGQYEFDGEMLRILGEKVIIDGEILFLNDLSITGLIEGSKVYIQAWDKEVDHTYTLRKYGNENGEETVTNHIKDVRVGVETTKRFVLTYALSNRVDNAKHNLLLGEVKNGKFVSSVKNVGKTPVKHISSDGTPIQIMNLEGSLVTVPQFSPPTNINFSKDVIKDGLMLQGYSNSHNPNMDGLSFIHLRAQYIGQTNLVGTFINIGTWAKHGLSFCLNIHLNGAVTIHSIEADENDTPLKGLNLDVEYTIAIGEYIDVRFLIDIPNKVAICYINNKSFNLFDTTWTQDHISNNFSHIHPNVFRDTLTLQYSRELNEEELNHNLNVLNFSSLDNLPQDFIENIGGEIQQKHEILSGLEIQGRTILQCVNPLSFSAMYGTYDLTTNLFTSIETASATRLNFSKSQLADIQTNSKYYYSFIIKGAKELHMHIQLCNMYSYPDALLPNELTLVSGIIDTLENLGSEEKVFRIYFDRGGDLEIGDEVYISPVQLLKITDETKEELDKMAGRLIPNIGFNSVEAVVDIGGEKVHYYEPEIKGKTEVIDGKLVSLNPSIIGLPALGSVSSIADTLDINSRVLHIYTKEITLNGSENWRPTNLFRGESESTFSLSISDLKKANNVNVLTTFKNDPDCHRDVSHLLGECWSTQSSFDSIYISWGTTSLSEFKTQLAERPITIRYQLVTSITKHLTAEEFNAYDIYKKVICLNQVEDVSDILIQKTDSNDIVYDKRIQSDTITGKSISNILQSQSTGDTVYIETNVFYGESGRVLSDKYSNDTSLWDNFDTVGIFLEGSLSSNKTIRIRELKEKCGETLESVTAYLNENPTEVKVVSKNINRHLISCNNISKLQNSQINNRLIEIQVDSPILPSSFSFTHYPSIESVLNTLGTEELVSLSDLTKPFINYESAETNLTSTNIGYLSGGFINIPFHLRERAYVRTEQVKLYDDITLVLMNTTATEITISKTTENLSLVNVDSNKFVLRIPTTESGVGTVFLTSNSFIGIGVMKGE